MRLMILGILLGLISIWGGGYLFYLFADTWMEYPMFMTSAIGTGIGVVFFFAGMGDI